LKVTIAPFAFPQPSSTGEALTENSRSSPSSPASCIEVPVVVNQSSSAVVHGKARRAS
jgi:hypothetical protein